MIYKYIHIKNKNFFNISYIKLIDNYIPIKIIKFKNLCIEKYNFYKIL